MVPQVGFTEANVRAICSIGQSTKRASDARFIGQKGIGFKSVFKLTPVPEVHSRVFHFRFDARQGGLGYLLPLPIPAPLDWDAAEGTRIVLPFQREPVQLELTSQGRINATPEFCRRLTDDVQPQLLLFLHQVKRLELHQRAHGQRRLLQRVDVSPECVRLSEESSQGTVKSQHWLVLKQSVVPPAIRKDVASTEIALALPLPEAGATGLGGSDAPLPLQEVYAFLPMRSYGFRLVVQADWLVTATREAVDTSQEW